MSFNFESSLKVGEEAARKARNHKEAIQNSLIQLERALADYFHAPLEIRSVIKRPLSAGIRSSMALAFALQSKSLDEDDDDTLVSVEAYIDGIGSVKIFQYAVESTVFPTEIKSRTNDTIYCETVEVFDNTISDFLTDPDLFDELHQLVTKSDVSVTRAQIR
ncbi:hypothetical protein [Vibrio splendidus]|uniref:hypothetical protein n=1 Tax=Vibrio splendidus TaxID=29497 RepID=UPI000C843EB5|nr:hypothetical protein [Vibrio splendidus]PMP42554.1 hypothetical protein BCS86_13760 [Vibrio splendidus]